MSANQVGPLEILAEHDAVRFRLLPHTITAELPTDYEQTLFSRLTTLPAQTRVLLDLDGTAAVSSRELGVLLTLRKVLAEARGHERLRLTGVSSAVRRVLEVSRTSQFFEIDNDTRN